MIDRLPKISKIAEEMVEAFKRLGVTGEIEVKIGGARLVRWIGQPSERDVIVKVRIERTPSRKATL